MQLYKEWMPAWDKAELQELSGNKVVEVPLMFKKIRASVSDDLLQAYKETNDPKYLIADIKLIIEKDSATSEMRGLIREITPTLEYLQANDFNPICLSRMDELSGSVKYFTPDWQLIYIYTYENGEITKGLTVNPRTRSGEEYCFTFTELVITDWHLNSPDGPYITTTYGYTFITYCISAEDSGIDDSGSGGGSGDGGGGGAGGNSNNNNTVYPILELEAVGNGSVSPGGTTYYSPNQNVTITATPHSSAVFGGWYEHSSIISNSHSIYIQMNYDRCIQAYFIQKTAHAANLHQNTEITMQ